MVAIHDGQCLKQREVREYRISSIQRSKGYFQAAQLREAGYDIDITRFNIGGGWFMTKNVLAKVEYVTQKYDGFATGNIFDGGKFNGFVAEAVISF